jgi:pimeloyl-ACP methyl ester carboxylesterase
MRLRLILAVCATLAVSSCVGNRAWRVRYGPDGVPKIDQPAFEKMKASEFDPTGNITGEFSYRLGFVEFDDRGEMFERQQLTNIVKTIGDAKEEARGKQTEAVVVVFVHGWKNNASDRSGNVWGFRRTLAGLASQWKGAPVVGVYIGWRGAVVSAPILKEFTFWDRRDKSQNLPNAHMVETLLTIMRAAKGKNYEENTVSVLVGHSFGAAVLETALTQPLEGMVLAASRGEDIRWPANLVVLVNEASPASRSYQLIESLIEHVEKRPGCRDGELPVQHPVLVSITSTGDYATRAFFPFGQTLSRPRNSLRKYPRPNAVGLTSQASMFYNTTAHMSAFQSHLMGPQNSPEIQNALSGGCPEYFHTAIEGTTYSVVERPGSKNLSPYWVMRMPPSIVPDHSTIFVPEFRKLLIDFVLAPQVQRRTAGRAVTKEAEPLQRQAPSYRRKQ